METLFSDLLCNQVAEIELVYKTKVKASVRPQIRSSRDASEIFRNNWDENKMDFIEQFKVLLLSKANRVLAIYEQSTGGITSTIADARLIYVAALKAGASNIIICHNHPSGNLKPSITDQEMTTKLKQAGELLEIRLYDHIIITSEGYYSFADSGLV